jgi:hypothetical protein
MSMFRVQHQVQNSVWVDLGRTPQGPAAQGLADVRRTVAADQPVRVVQDPVKRGQLFDILA